MDNGPLDYRAPEPTPKFSWLRVAILTMAALFVAVIIAYTAIMIGLDK